MGMSVTQKILASKCGLKSVEAGDLIFVNVDKVMANDITAPVAISALERCGLKVKDASKVILVLDHFVPNKDIKSAEQCACVRRFAKGNKVDNFFDVGRMGIEHALLPEQGLISSGDVIIGGDSHTCTYGALHAFSTGVGSTDVAYTMANLKTWFKVPSAIGVKLKGKLNEYVTAKDIILHLIGILGVDGALYKSLEFFGDVESIGMDGRMTIANMVVEAGAKNAMFPLDKICRDYLTSHGAHADVSFTADENCYERVIEIDLSALKPTVAFPSLPSNVKTEWNGIKIDQVVIGSCTNGRLDDLRAAAEILKGKKVADGVRCIIIPATQKIYADALKEGLIEIFISAGAVVSTSTCGPCLGGHMGILAKGETCVSTTNRNFVGRMGHVESKVYLASPYVAAASAVKGELTTPDKV